MKEFLKEYKFAITITLIIVIIGAIILEYKVQSRNTNLESYVGEKYEFKYDQTWILDETSENSFTLLKSGDVSLDCNIVKLETEDRFKLIDDFKENIILSIQEQNPEYILIAQEDTKITKNKYSAFKTLYEKDERQVLVLVARISENLVFFTYEAPSSQFDVSLDSAQTVMYNFEVVREPIELSYKIAVGVEDIEYLENPKVVKLLEENREWEIASNNYKAYFTLPKNFKRSTMSSSLGQFKFDEDKDTNIDLRAVVAVYASNIYDYIDKDKGSLYSDLEYVRNNPSSYYDFKESIQKMKDWPDSYIYKASYKSKNTFTSTISYNEEVKLVYSLNENHICVIELEGNDTIIPKELIEQIHLNRSENYAVNSSREIVDGVIKIQLMDFLQYKKDEIEIVNYYFPETFREEDYEQNMYDTRYFVKDYNEDLKEYMEKVKILCFGYSIPSALDNVTSNVSLYNEYERLQDKGQVTLNGKTFEKYEGWYKKNGSANIVYITVLYFDNDNKDGKNIEIKYESIGSKISDEELEQFTNFEIEVQKYEE